MRSPLLTSFASFIVTLGVVFVVFDSYEPSGDSSAVKVTSRQRRDIDEPESFENFEFSDKVDERLSEEKRITFDELFDGTYGYSRYSGATWSQIDPDHYFSSNNAAVPSIWKQFFSVDSLADGTLADAPKVPILNTPWQELCAPNSCSTYKISADEKYLLAQVTGNKLWRRSTEKQFWLYQLDGAGNAIRVLDEFLGGFKASACLYAGFAPQGNHFALVCNFNLYIVDPTDPSTFDAITAGGDEFKLLHGVCDWANEEENIKADNTVYWSPDGTKVMFASYDISQIDLLRYNTYDVKNGYTAVKSLEDRYPKVREIRYAKAGKNYAEVSLTMYDTVTKASKPMVIEKNDMAHLSRMSWSMGSDWLVMSWINRGTTSSNVYACTMKSAAETECSIIDSETSETGWIGFKGPFYPYALENFGDYFTIETRYRDNDESHLGDGYWRLARVTHDLDGANMEKVFLPAQHENKLSVYDVRVNKVIQHSNDDINKFFALYTLAGPEATQRHLYASIGDNKEMCLTCHLMDETDILGVSRCGWADSYVQKTRAANTYNLMVSCRGPGVPMTVAAEFVTHDNDEDMQSELKNLQFVNWYMNEDLETIVKNKEEGWIQRQYKTYTSPNWEEKPYNYELFLPKDFDPSAKGKYSLLVFVYGAPEYQNVDTLWTTDFVKAYLPSSYNVITALIDGRGSGYEGDKFMHTVYKRLGQLEMHDQIEVTKHIVSEHEAIDPKKVGIYGWSYGGYSTSHVLGYDAGETFKCGVAVAPLADWRYYDTIYAERYMGLPEENRLGYEQGSIVQGHDPNNYKNVDYTIIHGTDDDNVHFLNAVVMQKSLAQHNIEYQAEFYADEDHSIRSTSTVQKHIYKKILTNLLRCFKQDWRN